MRELSVVEQRYQAVLAVIADGRKVKKIAMQWGVSRQSLHVLSRYEAGGLEGLAPAPSSRSTSTTWARAAQRHGEGRARVARRYANR